MLNQLTYDSAQRRTDDGDGKEGYGPKYTNEMKLGIVYYPLSALLNGLVPIFWLSKSEPGCLGDKTTSSTFFHIWILF